MRLVHLRIEIEKELRRILGGGARPLSIVAMLNEIGDADLPPEDRRAISEALGMMNRAAQASTSKRPRSKTPRRRPKPS